MSVLQSLEQLDGIQDTAETVRVDVPEWGCEVIIGQCTALEYEEYAKWLGHESKFSGAKKSMYAGLVALCLRDESGKRIANIKTSERLAKHGIAPLRRLYEAACKLNGLGEAAEAEAKKNLPDLDDSSSDSQDT